MEKVKIGILIFNGLAALDAVGPYEILSRIPNAQVSFISINAGPIESIGGLQLIAKHTIYEDTNYDVIIIPGGNGIREMTKNKDVLNWVRERNKNSKYTTSVCTGALLLGAAGLLTDIKATTHWLCRDELKNYNAIVVKDRYIQQGKIITSAGVSAGLDMSLKLTELLTNTTLAQTIQLSIEYDPKPPFNSGSPETASEEMVNLIKSKYHNYINK